MKWGTKAETLEYIFDNISENAVVLPVFYFTVGQWLNQQEEIIKMVDQKFPLNMENGVIVRSSAIGEDSINSSMAGMYESVSEVNSVQKLVVAVEKVIRSYGEENPKDQVLVQPMLQRVAMSGVVFTKDPNTGGNYYIINYDDKSDKTDSITSGNSNCDKVCYIYKKRVDLLDSNFFLRLCSVLEELQNMFEMDNLDVEFAFDEEGILYILQARPLVVRTSDSIEIEKEQEILNEIAEKIQYYNQHKPFLFGDRTIWGVMPDWNPAEMIGIRPKPLAMSLYKEIITDNIWAYQRDNYGYRNLRSFPLMHSFYGLPYIDTRVSFNSFVPADIEDELGEKLVNYYLQCLEQHPEYHDKIEFDIAYTCYTFDLPERIKRLHDFEFSEKETTMIVDSLRTMTRNIIDNENGIWRKDYAKIKKLQLRYEEVVNSEMSTEDKIYWLIEDCKRYGTLPFAGLARVGFIAVELLKSMVKTNLIDNTEYQAFMGDVNTVSTMMTKDKRDLSRAAFMEKYGHLRPGTYDIVSKRYDEAADVYFNWNNVVGTEKKEDCSDEKEFKLSLEKMKNISEALVHHGISDNILDFFSFIRTAIEAREYSKFVFTKSLSKALLLIEELGKSYDISCEDMAFLDVHIIQGMYSRCDNKKTALVEGVKRGKRDFLIAKKISLPVIIRNEKEVYCFYDTKMVANFITMSECTAEIIVIEGDACTEPKEIQGKIVVVQSADPGYDWIFSHGIKGFITAYGGANSHMAIRAGEMGIPAAIGVGQRMYEKITKAKIVKIDAAGKLLQIVG